MKRKTAPSPRARLRAKLKQARKTLAKHEAVLAEGKLDGHLLSLRKDYAGNARRRIKRIEAALANGVHYEEKQRMRPNLADETFAVTPPHPGWTLRAWRALNLGGKAYRRGEEVPISALGRNADGLLRGGHIRWSPPGSVPKPPPLPPPPSVPRSEPPVDPIAACRSELRRIMKDRGVDFAMAVDLIDSRVYLKAQKHFADTPRTAVDGGFGSGGRARIQSGSGTSRRSIAGFNEHLQEGL